MKYVHGKDERHGCEMCADALYKEEILTKQLQVVHESF